MELEYKLTLEDFLIQQLFAASQSKRIRLNRLKGWLGNSIFCILLGVGLYFLRGMYYLVGFFGVAIFWIGLYPFYSRWLYRKHYREHIEENYKNRIDHPYKVIIEKNQLRFSDSSSEERINSTEVKSIFEISTHYFVKFDNGSSLNVPKHSLNACEVTDFINELCKVTGLEIEKKLDWKWR